MLVSDKKKASRINISVTNFQALDLIDAAAEKAGVSRSQYMIETTAKRAKEDLKKDVIVKKVNSCEVCDKRVYEKDVWAWAKAKKHGVGHICCVTCVDSINELPEEVALAALKAKK